MTRIFFKILVMLPILLNSFCYRSIINKEGVTPLLQPKNKTGIIVYLNRDIAFNASKMVEIDKGRETYLNLKNDISELISNSGKHLEAETGGNLKFLGIYGFENATFDEGFALKKQKKKNTIEFSFYEIKEEQNFTLLLSIFTVGIFPLWYERTLKTSIRYWDDEGNVRTLPNTNSIPILKSYGGWLLIPFAFFSKEDTKTLYQYTFDLQMRQSMYKYELGKYSKADYEIFPLKEKQMIQADAEKFLKDDSVWFMIRNEARSRTERFTFYSKSDNIHTLAATVFTKNISNKPIQYNPNRYFVSDGINKYKLDKALNPDTGEFINQDIELQPGEIKEEILAFYVPHDVELIYLNYSDPRQEINFQTGPVLRFYKNFKKYSFPKN